jgi:molybdate transport system substrate-binding protein
MTLVALMGAAFAGALLTGCDSTPTDASGTTAPSPPARLRISAASSLRAALEYSAAEFEDENNVEIECNFAASGILQKQIEAGAPVDAFISASAAQVATLVAEGLIVPEAASVFAGNRLVIFVPAGNPARITDPNDLLRARRIVIGNPETAPHGTKAREWLTGLELWERLGPRLVYAENAAQTLDYVARGEVDAGIGFASETTGRTSVEAVYTVPSTAITPILYVAAPILGAEQPALAASYISYLSSPRAQRTLVDSGFLPAPAK